MATRGSGGRFTSDGEESELRTRAKRTKIFDGRGTGTSVIEVDRGMKRFIKAVVAVGSSDGPKARVGLRGDLADRAVHNEFGAPRANVPERSFLRSTFDEEKSTLIKMRNQLIIKLITGKLTKRQAMEVLGLHLEAKTKQKVIDLDDPKNAQFTIDKKGFDDPLRETDDMLQAIESQVD